MKTLIRLKIILLSLTIYFPLNIHCQNGKLYCCYDDSTISIKVSPPVIFYKDKINIVGITIANLSNKSIYIDPNFRLNYNKNTLFLDNTHDPGIETSIKFKRIANADTFFTSIILDNQTIAKHIKYDFSLQITFGYLPESDIILADNLKSINSGELIEISNGLAFMIMKRIYLVCGLVNGIVETNK